MSEYPNDFCFYKFHLGYLTSSMHDFIEPKKIQNARLVIDFHPSSQNESLSCVVYSEVNQVLAINQKREVLRDFVL